MKVILLQDVAKIGRRFEVAEVPDGYALNKLIPSRLAEPATPENLKKVKLHTDKQAASAADTSAAFTAAEAALKNKTVEVSVEANQDGTMFQALKLAEVVAAVSAALKVELEEKWLQITSPIKTVGEHTILLSHGDTQSEFTVNVVSNK